MIYFITGKPNSGKSLKAEELALSVGDPVRIYVATMQVKDDAGRERVNKHVRQREGKGFETVEIPYGMHKLYPYLENGSQTTVLLEDLSNLVGNEMYENPEGKKLLTGNIQGNLKALENAAQKLAGKITEELCDLAKKVHCLIIVSAEYEISEQYDEETNTYISILNTLNDKVKKISDKVLS